jgi:hypothetical protein
MVGTSTQFALNVHSPRAVSSETRSGPDPLGSYRFTFLILQSFLSIRLSNSTSSATAPDRGALARWRVHRVPAWPCRRLPPEASEGDRERGPRRTHRWPVVAVLPDGARSAGAFRREPHPDLARPRRRAGATRPLRQEDGTLSARYWSEAVKERKEPSGVFYYWKGERPRDPNAPQLDGTGEILLESADRAAGYFTTRSDAPASVNARTAGVYWRADPEDCGNIMDGNDDRRRAELIAEQLRRWKSITNA